MVEVICMKLLFNNWKYKEENYDYSQIYSINGVVTNAYFKVNDNSAYIDIKLETGKIVTIGIGGKLSYSKGEDIIVYTDGNHYSITEKGVANEAQNTIIIFFAICITEFFIILIWSFLFGWKGIFIGVFVAILLTYC